MLKEANSTLRLPTVARSPRLKVPRCPETIRLPKPTVVVRAARATPLAVLAGRVMARADASNCHRARMMIPNSIPSPRIKGTKRTLAWLKGRLSSHIKLTVRPVPTARGIRVSRAIFRLRNRINSMPAMASKAKPAAFRMELRNPRVKL